MGALKSSCIKANSNKSPRKEGDLKGFEDFERSLSMENKFFMDSAIVKKEDRYFSKQQDKYYKSKFSSTSVLKSTKSKKRRKIKWKEGELVGHGSFGRVILGFNLDTGELMAVKQIISPLYSQQEEVRNPSFHFRNLPPFNQRLIY